MSIISDIEKLNPSLKNALYSVLLLCPFSFLALYLLEPEFYNKADLFIKISVAYCFSMWYYVLTLFMMVFEKKIDIEPSNDYILISTAIVPSAILFTFLAACFYVDFSFISFVIYSSVSRVVVAILCRSFDYFKSLYTRRNTQSN